MLNFYTRNRKWIAICYGIVYVFACYFMLLEYVPKSIVMAQGENDITLDAPISVEKIYTSQTVETEQEKGAIGEKNKLHCKLFGVIPIATIQATTVANKTLTAVGQPIGIYMKMKNVYVVGNKEFKTISGEKVNPTEYKLKEGDYILEVNDTWIYNKEQLLQVVQNSEGEALNFTLLRGKETMSVQVKPERAEGDVYKLGLWVKDDMAGVGTMTYMDEEGHYGALGHGVNDSATKELLQMDQGYIYQTDITEIKPSSMGSPGELTGLIAYGKSTCLGEINKNCGEGIYGTVTPKAESTFVKRIYPIGYKQEIKHSDASLLFGEEGDLQSYQIVIDKINYTPREKNKAFVFHVTDAKLIDEMGGIVQGMSGSPIIQNGKIIGAVTHVFVNDPTKGYGIFIEDMLEP